MSQSDSECPNCGKLRDKLNETVQKNVELESLNEKLSKQIETLRIEQEASQKRISELLEDSKKNTMSQFTLGLSTLPQQQDLPESQDQSTPGGNLKKIQQELRVSKKAEQLAKDKLAQTKKSLERSEKDFNKYKEDAELRIEGLKNEIAILQKHYDQLQDSINESEMERSQHNSANGDKSNGLIKIIEEYSKQSEQKSKEIEALIARIDKKQGKLDELKKNKLETDSKMIKLKSSLDNVKTFLRLLNNNYMKTMKQQSQSLKEQFTIYQAEYQKEIQSEKELKDIITAEKQKSLQLENKLEQIQKEFTATFGQAKQDYEQNMSNQKETLNKKILNLKEKVSQLSTQQQSEGDQKNQLKDQYTLRIQQLEKDNELLSIKMKSEQDKNQIQISELNKDLTNKQAIITDLKEKKNSLQSKYEELANKYQSDLQKLRDKLEEEKNQWILRETGVQRTRENERIQEIKSLYEVKSKEKEDEINRYRDHISKIEAELTSIKLVNLKQVDGVMDERMELEKNLILFKTQVTDLERKQSELNAKINKHKEKKQQQQEKIELQAKEIQNNQSELKSLTIKNQDLKTANEKINEQLTKQNSAKLDLQAQNEILKEKLVQLDNQFDQVRFDLNDEVKDKESHIERLTIQIKQHEKSIHQLKTELNAAKQEKENSLQLNQQYESQIQQARQEKLSLFDQIQALQENLSQIQQQNITLQTQQQQQVAEPPKEKKKRVVKKKKTSEFSTQTELVQQADCEIQTENLSEIVKEIVRESREEPAQPPKLNSPVIRGEYMEESQERKIERIIDQPDMAMRGPQFGNPRMLPPNQMGRGRGGIQPRPQMSQPRPRAPFGMVQQQRPAFQQQEQPFQQNEQIQPQVQEIKNQTPGQENDLIKQQIPVQEEQRFQPAPVRQEIQREEFKVHHQQQALPQITQNQKQPDEILTQRSEVRQEIQEEIKQAPKTQIQEEEKSAPPTQPPQNNNQPIMQQNTNQQPLLDLRNNRFFGMINGFIGFLTRRKQGYTGRPASQMFWDEKKKRYVIEGDDESDDDIPPPPPPMKKQVAEEKQDDKKVEELSTVTNPMDLTRPALPGYLANRGRSRGARGGSTVAQNRFPQTFGMNQITETQIERKQENEKTQQVEIMNISANESQQNIGNETQRSIKMEERNNETDLNQTTQLQSDQREEQQTELYMTTLDITMNQTQIIQEQSERRQEKKAEQQKQDEQTQITQSRYDELRESQWLDKFSSQQEKINNLKYKISMLQQELKMQREENEQTVENFTLLCQDLKFKGMDEVEDLQNDIQILRDQLKELVNDKAVYEIKNSQLADSLSYLESENEEIRGELSTARVRLIQVQVENESMKNQIKDVQQVEEKEDNSYKTILDLQSENSNLKWQKSILEAEKLSKTIEIKDLQSQLDFTQPRAAQLEKENTKLIEDQRLLQQELIQHQQETQIKYEKEKEALKDVINKVQLEKERVQEQNRERFQEYESRLKQTENDKQKFEQDLSKLAREKEIIIEQLKNKNLALAQTIQQRESDITFQKDQINQLSSKVQQLIQKRQSESEQAEVMMKNQLKQIQDMLQQKTSQLLQYENKQEEINLELNNMNMIRHKLTENIVYLQNEIRKRDELLETSEFGDFEFIGDEMDSMIAPEDESVRGQDLQSNKGDDDANGGAAALSNRHLQMVSMKKKRKTFGQQLQNQLDEARAQLKQHIEEKMRVQRQYQLLDRNYTKIAEGLQDINQILDQQQQNCGINPSNFEQSSQLYQEEETKVSDEKNASIKDDSLIMKGAKMDEIQHQIIQKVFSISRHYESEISEQNHKYKMIVMQLEESENLKFDIEILNDEKAMIEQELLQSKIQQRELEFKNQELTQKSSFMIKTEEDLRAQIDQMQQRVEKQQQRERQDYEKQLNSLRDENFRKINEINDNFNNQILPQISQKNQAKIKSLQDQFIQMREDFNNQLQEQKRIQRELENKNKSILDQSQLQIETESEEKYRLKEQLNFLEIQKQELENQLSSVKLGYQGKINQLNDDIKALKSEIDLQTKQFDEYKDNLERSFREAALKLKAKIDEKKKQMKDMQTKFREQFEIVIKSHQEEVTQIRKGDEEKLEAANRQVLSNKQTEDSLRSEIQTLKDQLNQQLNESIKVSSEQQEELNIKHQSLLNAKDQEIQSLQSELSSVKTLLEQQESENKKLQEEKSEILVVPQVDEAKIKEYDDTISQLNNKLKQIEVDQQSQIENQQNITRQVKQQLREEIDKLNIEISELKEKLSQAADQKEEQSEQEQKINEVESKKDLEIQDLSKQVTEFADKNKQLVEQIERLVNEKHELEAKLSQISEVNAQNEGILVQITAKDEEITTLRQDMYRYQQDQERIISELNDKIQQQEAASKENESKVDQNQIDLQLQILESEFEAKMKVKEEDFEKEKQDMIEYFNGRESEMKTMTEQIALKLKGDIKKHKEKAKNVLNALEQAQKDKEQQTQNIEELNNQIRRLQQQKISVAQSQIKEFQDQIDALNLKVNEQDKELKQSQTLLAQSREDTQSLLDFCYQLASLMQQKFEVIGESDLVVDTKDDRESFYNLLNQKLGELLQNFEEDKRALRSLMDEKEHLESLKDQYYHQAESLLSEKSVLQDKLEQSDAMKLEKKVKMMEEERSEMRSDFNIKINSFVMEIDDLKTKLSRYEEPIPQIEQSEQSIKQGQVNILDDMSMSRASQSEIVPTFMDQSKMSVINQAAVNQEKKQGNYPGQQQITQQQKSGLFTSIASFFLTDSELDTQ
ncbi:UNKNOWN [Stylonychia lemnae]|uniref:Uncharacterized protein n=1 Tax=Stylonychia lemnae TaxID=5949 RepID=A0A078ABJ8_STYLE|nr:UNKNOWN [Stylonychia lemnae]|eukprot:CDW79559.1 UNKNOWN [Stylonychia lemnae]